MQKGKTLLVLNKAFPKNEIIKKMLVEEFKETKVVKPDLAYNALDSDEDTKRKHP